MPLLLAQRILEGLLGWKTMSSSSMGPLQQNPQVGSESMGPLQQNPQVARLWYA